MTLRRCARMSARTGRGSRRAPGACRASRRARSPPPASLRSIARLRTSLRRESAEVLVEMALDLPLGLGDEAEARRDRRASGGQRADREGAGVPERIEQARPRAEFLQARLAPGQVIAPPRARPPCSRRARVLGAGEQGLAVVERLGGDLPGVVHAHQGRGTAPLGLRKWGSGAGRAGKGAAGARRCKDGAQRAIGGGDDRVEGATRHHI